MKKKKLYINHRIDGSLVLPDMPAERMHPR